MNKQLFNMIDDLMYEKLVDIHNELEIEFNPVNSRQAEKWNRLEEELSDLFIELVKSNSAEKIYFDNEEGRIIKESELKKWYNELIESDLGEKELKFEEYVSNNKKRYLIEEL